MDILVGIQTENLGKVFKLGCAWQKGSCQMLHGVHNILLIFISMTFIFSRNIPYKCKPGL